MTETRSTHEIRQALLDAALPHVAFDGWSAAAFEAALVEAEIAPAVARAICPRGAVDLALAFHARGDAAMVARLTGSDLGEMRFRDRIAAGVRFRLEAAEAHKDEVRRAVALFSLPHLAPDGAKMVWGTADKIWTALGDVSEDLNWYSKRATLAGVYSATVLFWLGDDSADHAATWAFLDRRIDDVMRIEKAKKAVKDNPVLSKLLPGPNGILGRIRKPQGADLTDMPGRWTDPAHLN